MKRILQLYILLPLFIHSMEVSQPTLHELVTNIQMLQSYLERGLNVDITDCDQKTLLYLAVEKNCYQSVELLLAYKASIYKQDTKSITPLMAACKDPKHFTCLKLLLNLNHDNADSQTQYSERTYAARTAIDYNNIIALKELAGYGINVNDFLLSTACGLNNIHAGSILIFYGANIDQQDFFKQTPLIYSCQQKANFETTQFLLSQNTNKFLCDLNGKKAIDYATSQEEKELLSSPKKPLIPQLARNTMLYCYTQGKNVVSRLALREIGKNFIKK